MGIYLNPGNENFRRATVADICAAKQDTFILLIDEYDVLVRENVSKNCSMII